MIKIINKLNNSGKKCNIVRESQFYPVLNINLCSKNSQRTFSFYFLGLLFLLILSCTENNLTNNKEDIQCNNIRHYLINCAKEITNSSLQDIKSLKDWNKIKQKRYYEFIEMLSLQDMPLESQRSPLNIKRTGIIQRDGYRIEKLYYQSLPGLYVPANLYIPDNLKEPAPAILYLCGHALTQKVHYQTHPAKFAKLGFVCLIIETIQWGEVLGEHHGCYARGWFNWYSRGYTPAGVEVWNAIRGLDLLSDRLEVNSDKIGVTGISGGGAMSWFTAAADPRIKAVAPICGASTLEAHLTTGTIDRHCDCMMPINTYRIDFQDIGALIAPRPLLIGQSHRDGLNTIESVYHLYRDIKRIYDLYEEPENIEIVEYPGGHAYHKISREKIFSFFMEYLADKHISPEETGDIDTSFNSLLSAEALRVYTEGAPKDDRTTIIQDSFVTLAEAHNILNKKDLTICRDSVRTLLLQKTFGAFPKNPPPFKPELIFRTLNRADHGSDIYSFVSEEGWRLKVDLRWRNSPSEKKPLMIVLKNMDENRGESEDFINKLNGEWNIAYFEVRGVGENGWSPELQWHIRRASAWTGRTIASMQVYDLLRCIDFCRSLKGVDPKKIGIAGRDAMSVVALYAALLDGKCQTIVLKNPPETQDIASSPDGRGDAIEMLNCLRITDVYQIPLLLYPVDIVLVDEIPDKYKWSENTLKLLGKKGFLKLEEI